MEFKLQPASRKEVARIAKGTVLLAAALVAMFGLSGLAGAYPFTYTIPLAAAVGSAVAVLNFTILCLTVQNAANLAEDPKAMRAAVQLSYNLRLGLQAGWVILCFVLPCFQVVAGALPLLFPNLIIYWLQATGRIAPKASGQQQQEER